MRIKIIKKIIIFKSIEFIAINYSLSLNIKEFKAISEDNELDIFTTRYLKKIIKKKISEFEFSINKR